MIAPYTLAPNLTVRIDAVKELSQGREGGGKGWAESCARDKLMRFIAASSGSFWPLSPSKGAARRSRESAQLMRMCILPLLLVSRNGAPLDLILLLQPAHFGARIFPRRQLSSLLRTDIPGSS